MGRPTLRPLTLRCPDGCQLGVVGQDLDRQLVIAGQRTATYASTGGRPTRTRGAIDGKVPADAPFVAVGCDHWPGLAVDVDDLRAWVADAAAGGRRVRIVRRGPG